MEKSGETIAARLFSRLFRRQRRNGGRDCGIFSGKESLGDKKERKIIKDEKRGGS